MFKNAVAKSWVPLALAMFGACATAVRAQTPASAPVEPGIDLSVAPGDDFFAFANGEWLKATQIPTGSTRWTARDEIKGLTRQQVEHLINDAATAPVGQQARKVADFRAAYANEKSIEAHGLAGLAPLLSRIEAVRDKAALAQLLGSEMRADVDPLNLGIYDSANLFGLSVEPGARGEKSYVAFLLQGGLGLPDRDDYVSEAADRMARRIKYQAYIARMLELAGLDRAATRAEAVMTLETAIARSHSTQEDSANERNAENLWTRADFARQAPGLDWTAFFAAAGLSGQETFVVWQPGAVTGAAALVASEPLSAWQDYLRFRALDTHADTLPRVFAETAFELHANAVSGQWDQNPRAMRALGATQQAMSGPLARMYVEKYFPPPFKARVQVIASNVIAAFVERVERVTWLAPESKALAIAKLKTVYFGVGYPGRWPDYSNLAISPANPLENEQQLEAWSYRNALAKVGEPADLTGWWITPQSAGAVLMFQQNSYNFSAALLQPPKFDPAASDAANYGAIGAIVAHEVSHFVDTLGADYDIQGRKVHWWTAEDAANYQAATRPLVDQYSNYHPLPELSIDGKSTLVENLADLGGLAAAFDAYRRALGGKALDKAHLRQQDRQFFIGFARSWRAKTQDEALRKQIANDGHAPESYRAATVRNMDAWYRAFDVKRGQRLYLEPKARVRVW